MALRLRPAAAPTAAAIFALSTLLGATVGVHGQDRFPLGPGPYDPAVPTVAEARGFPTGTSFSTYREIERVVEAIAHASDRVRLETYGISVEGRPLRIAWISAPENLARLDELRRANVALAEGGAIPPDLADRPLFVWLSFGIHGDEGGSTETALELVHHLAASRDPAIVAHLEKLVVAVDPVLNPDGHERYAVWYRSTAGGRGDPDPAAREHRPPWAPGRTNHWLFDLNRDWAWGVMPETRARLGAYLSTLPQIHVDFHEMDAESTYFFFPAGSPVHALYPPSTTEWGRVFGAANAAAFDARGWPYYTREKFDLFYPGYGDSWPSFFGATGMTYEQAGGGRAGVVFERSDGSRLTLEDRVEHHLVAALTTLETAADRQAERMDDFADFWSAEDRRAPGAPAAWIVPASGGDARALARLLERQGVEIDTLAEGVPTEGLVPYRGVVSRDTLPVGSFVVASDQPLGRYVAALMSPRAELPDTSLFYDITGWSLPYLHDVDAWRSPTSVTARLGRWTPGEDPRPSASPDDIAAAVTIAWTYEASDDVAAAARLLGRGIVVRVAERPFRAGGRAFGRGAFLVPLADVERPDAVWRQVVEAGARPVLLFSHRTEDGVDLGSDRIRTLRPPRIAIAAGPGIRPTSTGAAWWLLSEYVGLPVDVVRARDFAAAPGDDADSLAGQVREPLELAPYTAIVLPDASHPDALEMAMGERGADRLAAWVRAGGTLVGIRHSAAWLSSDRSGIAPFALAPEPEPSDEERRSSSAERAADELRARIPGTLLAVRVDTTSVLGYGFRGRGSAVLVRNPPEFELADQGNAYVYADEERLAGYLPPDARERLAHTPYALVGELGRGRIVLFADDPGFRGILRGLRKALLNAVLIVPGS